MQVASHILGVPVAKIKVKATSTTTNANSTHQGATVCSDIVLLVSFMTDDFFKLFFRFDMFFFFFVLLIL